MNYILFVLDTPLILLKIKYDANASSLSRLAIQSTLLEISVNDFKNSLTSVVFHFIQWQSWYEHFNNYLTNYVQAPVVIKFYRLIILTFAFPNYVNFELVPTLIIARRHLCEYEHYSWLDLNMEYSFLSKEYSHLCPKPLGDEKTNNGR